MDSSKPTPVVNVSLAAHLEAARMRNAIARAAEHSRREAAKLSELADFGDLEITKVTIHPPSR